MTYAADLPKSDSEMEEYFQERDFKRLTTARASAEKWVGSITALTGLVGLVTILKGAESTSKVAPADLSRVGVLLGISFTLLVLGVLLTSAAAYGIPFLADKVVRTPEEGLLTRGLEQIKKYAKRSRILLTVGLGCVVLGLAFLLGASWKTWIPAQAKTSEADSVCVIVNGSVVAKINAGSLDLKELTGAEIGACP